MIYMIIPLANCQRDLWLLFGGIAELTVRVLLREIRDCRKEPWYTDCRNYKQRISHLIFGRLFVNNFTLRLLAINLFPQGEAGNSELNVVTRSGNLICDQS